VGRPAFRGIDPNSRPRSRQRAQALVEFALISAPLALLLLGAIQFGLLFGYKIQLSAGASAGARWASLNPSAWSAAAAPGSNTIEGQVLGAAGAAASVPNDDNHLAIQYYAVSGSTVTYCGRYQGGAFVAQSGYTQASCVLDGSLVKVTVTNSYPVLFRLFSNFGANISLNGQAAMVLTG
jgi:Flp pilus assembly protein TadG